MFNFEEIKAVLRLHNYFMKVVDAIEKEVIKKKQLLNISCVSGALEADFEEILEVLMLIDMETYQDPCITYTFKEACQGSIAYVYNLMIIARNLSKDEKISAMQFCLIVSLALHKVDRIVQFCLDKEKEEKEGKEGADDED